MKKRITIILALALMLSLTTAPVTQALADQTFDTEKTFVLDDNSTISYEKLAADTLDIKLTLSEAEQQKFHDKIVADFIKNNPDLPLDIVVPYTDAKMQETRENMDARMEASFSRNAILLDKQTEIIHINIDTNEQLSRSSTKDSKSTTTTLYNPNQYATVVSDAPNRTQANAGMGWADAQTDYQVPYGAGSGYAMSAVGMLISVNGSGSIQISSTARGTYDGYLQVGSPNPYAPLSSNAFASVDYTIYELNTSTGGLKQVASSNINDRGVTFSMYPNPFYGNISKTLTTTLYGGKTYYFALSAYTEASASWQEGWFYFSTAKLQYGANGAPGGYGVDFTSLSLTY